MTIEIWGRRRHGKTQMAVALSILIGNSYNCPIYSNETKMVEMGIAKRLTKNVLLNETRAVFMIDEFWREMDSQDWKNPQSRLMTHWWQLQGHRDLILIYTTQLRSQMNNRIRNSNDYSIYCERFKSFTINGVDNYRFVYKIFDGFTWELNKTLKTSTEKIKFLHNFYDHIGTPELVLS